MFRISVRFARVTLARATPSATRALRAIARTSDTKNRSLDSSPCLAKRARGTNARDDGRERLCWALERVVADPIPDDVGGACEQCVKTMEGARGGVREGVVVRANGDVRLGVVRHCARWMRRRRGGEARRGGARGWRVCECVGIERSGAGGGETSGDGGAHGWAFGTIRGGNRRGRRAEGVKRPLRCGKFQRDGAPSVEGGERGVVRERG